MTEQEIDDLRKMVSAVEQGSFMPTNRMIDANKN